MRNSPRKPYLHGYISFSLVCMYAYQCYRVLMLTTVSLRYSWFCFYICSLRSTCKSHENLERILTVIPPIFTGELGSELIPLLCSLPSHKQVHVCILTRCSFMSVMIGSFFSNALHIFYWFSVKTHIQILPKRK